MNRKLLIGLVALSVVIAGIGVAAVRLLAPSEDRAIELIPPDATFYANVFLDPSNPQKMAIRDLMEKFPRIGTPEEARSVLIELFDEGLREIGLTFEDDVEPWLGTQIAVYFTDFDPGTGEAGQGGVLVATDDADATQDAIDEGIRNSDAAPGFDERSYRGYDYRVATAAASAEVAAYGFVGDFLVLANEDGFRGSVDAFEDEALADTEKFDRATAGLTDDRLALVYLDLSTLEGLLQRQGDLPPGLSFDEIPGLSAVTRPGAAAFFATSTGVVIESSQSPSGDGSADGVGLLSELPADTWLALGVADLGARVRGLAEGLSGAGIPGVSFDALAQQLTLQTGLDLEQDIIDWMGDVALFVDGDLNRPSGGGLIESLDPELSRAALANISAALARFRVPVQPGQNGFSVETGDPTLPAVTVTQDGDRVALSIGGDGGADGGTLGDAEAFEDATSGLGRGFSPTFFLDLDVVIDLLEGAGALPSGEPDYEEFSERFLDPIGYVIAGSRTDGDRVINRIVVGVR